MTYFMKLSLASGVVASVIYGCAGSGIPIPNSVSVSSSEAGLTICTTVPADLRSDAQTTTVVTTIEVDGSGPQRIFLKGTP